MVGILLIQVLVHLEEYSSAVKYIEYRTESQDVFFEYEASALS